MNKNNMLKPYTVHYRDFQNIRLENCFYAFDAYEARTLAMEFNKYIHELAPKNKKLMSTPQHCSHFDIDEEAMLVGSSIFVELALNK